MLRALSRTPLCPPRGPCSSVTPGSSMAAVAPLKPLVAVAQVTSTPDKEQNFAACAGLVREAAQRGAGLVFLPEAFDFIGRDTAQTLSMAEPLDGDLMGRYARLARDCGVWLSLGGFHERGHDWATTQRIYNCHAVLDHDGESHSSAPEPLRHPQIPLTSPPIPAPQQRPWSPLMSPLPTNVPRLHSCPLAPRSPRGRLPQGPLVRRGARGPRLHEGEQLHQPRPRAGGPGAHARGEARPLRLLRPALPRALAGAAARGRRDPHLPLGLHRPHRLGPLGGAAAGSRHRDPVLRGGGRPDRAEPRAPRLLRPRAGGRSLGRRGGTVPRGARALLRRDRPPVPAPRPPGDPGVWPPPARPLRHRGGRGAGAGTVSPSKVTRNPEQDPFPTFSPPNPAALRSPWRRREGPHAFSVPGFPGARKEPGAVVDVYSKKPESYTGEMNDRGLKNTEVTEIT